MKLFLTFFAFSNAYSLFHHKKNPFYAVKPKDEPLEETKEVEESSQLRKLTGPENVFKFQQENGKILKNIVSKSDF